MGYYIIATDSEEKIVEYSCLVTLINNDNIEKCWIIDIDKNLIVKEFPVRMIQSYYVHSSGCIPCKISCPDYIRKAIESV